MPLNNRSHVVEVLSESKATDDVVRTVRQVMIKEIILA